MPSGVSVCMYDWALIKRAVAENELCVPSNEYTFPFVILARSNCIKMGLVRFEVSLTHFMPTHNSTLDYFIDCHSGAGWNVKPKHVFCAELHYCRAIIFLQLSVPFAKRHRMQGSVPTMYITVSWVWATVVSRGLSKTFHQCKTKNMCLIRYVRAINMQNPYFSVTHAYFLT